MITNLFHEQGNIDACLKQFLRGKRSRLAFVCLMGCAIASAAARSETVDLSVSDAKALQAIMRKDKFMQVLSSDDKGLRGLSALYSIMGKAIQGPLKIAIEWDKGTIKGWREANRALAEIGKVAICRDIQLASISGDNKEFFENLYNARGCD